MYHFVFPTKYRRVVIDDEVEEVIKETCIEISKRYEIYFLEIGTDRDHVHFLIQSVPGYNPMQIVKTVKSITAKEVFARCPDVKKKLWEESSGHRILCSNGKCCDRRRRSRVQCMSACTRVIDFSSFMGTYSSAKFE